MPHYPVYASHISSCTCSDSARHQSQDICLPISPIVLKNFAKINLIIKECPEEILIKLAIVLKITRSNRNTVHVYFLKFT